MKTAMFTLVLCLVIPYHLGAQSTSADGPLYPQIPTETDCHALTDQQDVLLFQNYDPWGYDSNQLILDSMGVSYMIAPQELMGVLNLPSFDVIIMASQQSTSFYQTYQNNMPLFEDYLNQGGVLDFHCATYSSYFFPGLTLPGGITQEEELDSYNYVADPTHPIAQGVPLSFNSNYASHVHLLNLLPATAIVTVDEDSLPTMIEYAFGSGTVIATGVTMEWIYGHGQEASNLLPNTIAYSLALAGYDSVHIHLTPYGTPIQIPAAGGSFDFNIEVRNEMGGMVNLDLWCSVILPNGSLVGPLLGPMALSLPYNFIGDRDRSQYIPGAAPSGSYIYQGHVGIHPTEVWDWDYFTFEKLGDGETTDGQGWTTSGESFDPWFESLGSESLPTDYASLRNCPNPFNPTTAISYQLSAVSFVNLTVFDVSGRLVKILIDDYRDAGIHEITFDGSTLPSGIYIYRLTTGEYTATGKMILMK